MFHIFQYIVLALTLLPFSFSQPPRAVLIDCGATTTSVINGREWVPDGGFISTGVSRNITQPTDVVNKTLSTVRLFPLLQNNNRRRKFCYVVPVYRSAKYLVRSTYYYGGVNDGAAFPPVFDQIVDGTLWSVVNTTEDYVKGDASYYEGVFLAAGKSMSFCLASNTYTESEPFISALEFVMLADSLYNSTDFGNSSLRLVARHSFGYNGSLIRYPDDQFDRYWEPYGENNPTTSRGENVSINGFWNLPPLKVFQTQLMINQLRPLELQWPLEPLPNSIYYIALYFAEETGTSRSFSISINNVTYYSDLKVPQSGVALFANHWQLSGLTKIILTPTNGSTSGPLINGGEIFEVLQVAGRTHTRDAIGLTRLKESFQNPPFDWNGDPCLPKENSWTGITCSGGSNIRVTGLNLTSMGLLGSLSPNIANLTALSDLWLGNNNLSGPIPDLGTLRMLKTIHLEDNEFNGPIPSSLGNLDRLQELFLQNNNLTGQIPSSLTGKPGLNLRVSPGNSLLVPPNP
uniref:probable LRR receptor-like serine/threonine-protein kinase At1g67720 n=1 Tax=Erigeron canadensis TaxID=72917 RepID=UPI001CB92A5D|nr:probable LRR receptor-like serine/threonine-protein kinase At1g67720 [Erigeron canadensis]